MFCLFVYQISTNHFCFVCLFKLFVQISTNYFVCTVPTQIISKSYLIHQNDNDYSQRQSQAVPEGGSVKLSCKARGFPQWVSSTIVQNIFFYFVQPLHKILFYFIQPLHKIFLYFVQPLHKIFFHFFQPLHKIDFFKFVHLMCKIEFLGWSKSCTKYNICSTLAQK